MTDVEIIGLLKTYVNKTLVGGGALKGKNCTIDSIVPISGGNRVTFKWTLDDGTVETGHLDVMNGLNGQDGEDGKDGKGIQSVSVNAENHLIITYTDGTTDDAGQIEIHSAVDSVNGKTGAVILNAEDVGALPNDTPIPSKTSNLTNDSGFITKAVNDLVNYYLKSETYSKTQVDDIITAVKNSRFEVVATLPTTDIKTNVIYLVPKSPSQTSNVKDEYINLDGTTTGWEKIGDTEIDLSDYVTTQALNTALANYTTTADLTTLLAGKQDTLTFDNVPTENSNNPVKSGGVFTSEQDIFEVMGQNGAKNLITYPHSGKTETKAGITFTENADGSVTVNGTATEIVRHLISSQQFEVGKKYILSGCPSGGSHSLNGTYTLYTQTVQNYDDGEGVEFTWDASITGITIAVFAGITVDNLTFYPMIRLASDTDATYQPYAKTNQELTAENEALANQANDMVNVLGAKNHIRMPYYRSSGYVSSDLTYTYDSDGIITINGTKGSEVSFFDLVDSNKAPLDNLKVNVSYILSGGIGENEYLALIFYDDSDNPLESVISRTSGVAFTVPSGATKHILYYRLSEAKTYTNQKLYPMIRPASIQDDTYEPYAKTNQQLTEDTTGLLDNLEVNGAVNILPIDLNFIKANNSASSWSGNAYTYNGVTYTIDEANGKITVNGTASERSTLQVYNAIAGDLFKKSFKYLAKVFNNNFNIVNGYYVQLYMTNRPYTLIDAFTGNNFVVPDSFFDNSIRVSIQIVVEDGKSVDNQVITPLIAFGNYTGGFEKYAKSNRELTKKIDIVGNLFTTTTKVVDNITHGIATTIATLENLPIGTYVVSGQFNSDSAMNGGGLVQFASSGVIQNGATCSTIINQGFKANAGLTGIFNVTNATNQINLQIYTANADLTVASARLAAIRIA